MKITTDILDSNPQGFPINNKLKVNVPSDWAATELEGEDMKSKHFLDSVLYAKNGITQSITISSSTRVFDLNRLPEHIFKAPPRKSLKFLDAGDTKCFGSECIWQISKDGTMFYLTFSFMFESRLRVIHLSTDQGELGHEGFCRLISIFGHDIESSSP